MTKRLASQHSRYKHGKKGTRVYRIWKGMKQRCLNPRCDPNENYVTRGVTLCDRWHSFENFYADMGDPPSPEHELDKDILGNGMLYSPESCCWVTRSENCRNRRTNHLLHFKGQSLCIAEWAEKTGIKATTIYSRIAEQGWSTEDALTTPARCTNHLFTYDGRTLSLAIWALETGIDKKTLEQRLNKLGWSVEKTLTTPVRQRRKPSAQQQHQQLSLPDQDHSPAA